MMQLEFGGRRYPIIPGETVIGTAAECAVVLAGEGIQPRHAILHGSQAGAAIRPAGPEVTVLVNGVLLGGNPTPVLHGDKIQIGPHELLAVDPERAGRTQFFDARLSDVVPSAGAEQPAVPPAGGRLVCLTDGREYAIGEELVVGRDAGSDIVVPGLEVSRWHAEIRPTANGYLLRDESANGTYVNDMRVGRTHVLAHLDVIRIGNDEFRFYADPGAPETTPIPILASATSAIPTGATYRLSDTMHGIPAAELRRATPTGVSVPLASFLIRSGTDKGRRLELKTAVANIGRADYNDVIIADPSVSMEHAKLQRRDGLWILTDSGSTNGTYADGERVTDETPLIPGATVRFGEIVVLFEPHDEEVGVAPVSGTRVMDRIEVSAAPAPPASEAAIVEAPAADASAVEVSAAETVPTPRPLRSPRMAPETQRGIPVWLIVAALVAAAGGAAIGFLLLR